MRENSFVGVYRLRIERFPGIALGAARITDETRHVTLVAPKVPWFQMKWHADSRKRRRNAVYATWLSFVQAGRIR
jgi:hypothetical protein